MTAEKPANDELREALAAFSAEMVVWTLQTLGQVTGNELSDAEWEGHEKRAHETWEAYFREVWPVCGQRADWPALQRVLDAAT